MTQIFAGPGLVGINIDPTAADARTALRVAATADDAGFDVLAVQDHLYVPEYLDAWTLVCQLAARTTRVSVMPSVASLSLRSPAVLAKSAASLQILTGGRAILGVGAGAPGPGVAGLGGPRWASPGESVTAFEEALRVIRLLQRPPADIATFAGSHHALDGAVPGPVPPKPVPVWVGAVHPRALRLVGRYGDGWLAPASTHAPPASMVARQQIIDEAARDAGREPSEIRRTYTLLGTITAAGPGTEEDGRPLTGPAPFWVDTIGRYTDKLGFDSVVFCSVDGDPVGQAELFAEHVLPQLAGHRRWTS